MPDLAVCASGHTLWDDLSRVPGFDAKSWKQPFDIMAVNDAGMHIPYQLAHWYSNDGWLRYWKEARRPWFPGQEGPRGARNENIKYHSWTQISELPGLQVHSLQGGGTSSLNACLLGVQLKYEKIYLCGCPLDNGPHYFDPPWVKSNFDNTHELGIWESCKGDLPGVISMSGNTARILNRSPS